MQGHQKAPTEEEVIRQGKENQQDTPKHSDKDASKDDDEQHTASNSSEVTQKNEAADDPSTDTAQKLKQTSADEQDMATS